MPTLRSVDAKRLAVTVQGGALADDVIRVLAARGVAAEAASLDAAIGCDVIAHAALGDLEAGEAAALAAIAAGAAADGRALAVLVPAAGSGPSSATDHAVAIAVLRASGAVLCSDPDAWVEALVLLALFGAPAGPRTAIVAPPGTWLSLSASALAAEAAARGDRFAAISSGAAAAEPADCVLVDRSEAGKSDPAIAIPVVARAELAGDRPALVGLRAALAAVEAVGRQRERVAAGLGPESDSDFVDIDRERLARQLGKLGDAAGDHETKVLLSCAGVRVTRQAVATTPSAATRIAKKAGFPVEIKPWGADLPSELEGCPIETGITSNADVRRAYAAVCEAADVDAVIVRQAPPAGRELSIEVSVHGDLGLVLVVDVEGTPAPIAAVAPCREVDAAELAAHVVSSRAGDRDPDRAALADLLVRASALVATVDRIERLELSRVIAGTGPDDVMVVDARCWLRS